MESAVVTASAVLTAARLHELLDEALRRRMTTPERIAEALARYQGQRRAGSAVVGEVLRVRRSETTPPLSDWSRWFADRLVASGFPRPRLEHRITASDGGLVAQVDAAYVEHRLAFELDSVAHHHTTLAFEGDRLRDLRLAAQGWSALRVTWRQFTDQWHEIVAAVDAVLDQ